MKLKFVMSAKPAQFADQYHANMPKIKRLRQQLHDLEEEQDQLGRFLLKYSKGESFKYNSSDGYEKIFKVNHIKMFQLDQAKCKLLLKKKTPYRDVSYTRLTVDWVYLNKPVKAK